MLNRIICCFGLVVGSNRIKCVSKHGSNQSTELGWILAYCLVAQSNRIKNTLQSKFKLNNCNERNLSMAKLLKIEITSALAAWLNTVAQSNQNKMLARGKILKNKNPTCLYCELVGFGHVCLMQDFLLRETNCSNCKLVFFCHGQLFHL